MTGYRPTAFSAPDLRDSVTTAMRDALARTTGGGDTDDHAAHWQLAVEMGWLGATIPEASGGLALGLGFAADLCEEAGYNRFNGPLIETAVLLPALATECPALAPLLDGVMTGAVRLALAEVGSDAGEAVLAQQTAAATHVAILRMGTDRVSGTVLPHAACRLQPLQPLDPGSSIARVEVIDQAAAVPVSLSDAAAARVLRAMYVALAADLLGTGAAALTRSIAHVLERQQFGQPIGRFQAIKHRLADIHTALDAAQLAIAGAVRDGASTLDAAIARTLAAEAALMATRAAIQLHGGLGFSWESGLHLYLKRALRLNATAGGTRALRQAVGDLMITNALLPET